MKILELQAENIKRIRAVQIRPDGAVVHVVGANGAGKTSVLDAIAFGLGGADTFDSMPVRVGEQKARIRLDLGEIVVTRKFGPTGSTLTVEAANGARFPSPQAMLDELLGELTFDPLAFTRQSPKVQAETLRRLVPLDEDVDALDATAKAAYEERTRVNRDVRAFTEQVASLATAVVADADVTPIDVSALLTEMEQASTHNANLAKVAQARQREQSKAEDYRNRAAGLRERIRQLQDEADGYESAAAKIEAELATDAALPDEIDIGELRAQIEAAQLANKKREMQRLTREQHQSAVDKLTAAKLQAENLTATIEDCQQRKAASLARATMPIEGLAFTADGVTYHGIPLEQCSTAEQIRASVAIAMAMNPKLRILRIKDGSLLDERSLAIITEMADQRDYQVWLERVADGSPVGILIEDGTVAAIDGVPVDASAAALEPATA